jgi:hypothetical protein
MSARTDFAELHPQLSARAMRITLPEAYRPARPVRAGIETCRFLTIGCAHQPKPSDMSRDAEDIQSALLEPRTARPLPLMNRIAGAIWRWC